ncbi:MAG: ribosomal protection-like ABC-F family protein [Sporolactobacillus sp.]
MSLLELHNITYDVRDKCLFTIDEARVERQQRIGLVGKNGSGKTTLLRLIIGEIAATEGTIIRRGSCHLLPQLKQDVAEKSGGEIGQQFIREALEQQADLLLADEPTSFLDTDHIDWLERELTGYQGTVILVSHDRAFLDAICTTIWAIDSGQLRIYSGNYSSYEKVRADQQRSQQNAYEIYQNERRQLEHALRLKQQKAERATKKPKSVSASEAKITGSKPYFAKKQKKLQKTTKAIESRLKKLEKIDKVYEARQIQLEAPEAEALSSRVIVRLEGLEGRIGKRILWHPAHFFIRGGDKLAIIGANGSGKTTFVNKLVAGAAGLSVSAAVKIGYYRQDLSLLDLQATILQNAQQSSKQSRTVVQTVLARLGFAGADVAKRADVLSGGERVKLALAKLVLSEVNTLILDEPTTFLDIEAVTALETLLQIYPGTVLVVSHDRRFVANVATRIIAIEEQQLRVVDGDYMHYRQQKELEKRASSNDTRQARLLLETKIAEVLGKLSVAPSEELESEFQRLIREKKQLRKNK